MSELGQTRKSAFATAMSAVAPIATELRTSREVRFVPEADMAMGLFDHLVGASKNARRDDRILITKFVPDRRFAGGSPRLVASVFCPLLDRQLHKYQPAGPRDARVNRHNLLIVHVERHADRPCRRRRAGLLHLGKR